MVLIESIKIFAVCGNIFLFFNIISLIFHRNFNSRIDEEPENIIHSMSSAQRGGEKQRERAEHSSGRSEKTLLSLETLPDITVYHCRNEDKNNFILLRVFLP